MTDITTDEQRTKNALEMALLTAGQPLDRRALRHEYADYLRRLKPQRPPRLSSSLLEILAIIAYRQPVTRGDIEQLRGISVSSAQIAFLEEQEWIEEVGKRATPGRPVLYATTKIFLDDLGLSSLDDLPLLGDADVNVNEEEAELKNNTREDQ